MGAFWSAIRSNRKMLLTWGLLGTLALIYYLQKHYNLRTVDDYERLFEEAYHYALWGGGALALLIVPLVMARRRANKLARLDTSFKAQPQNYDKKVIMLTGRVERVFNVSFGEKMRRRTTKLVRKITGSTDQTGANIQQRFLLSSPQLRRGESIFVIHNINFGKLTLRRGHWFEVQGEYLHQKSPRRNPWRRLFLGAYTYYGKLHCTHEPKGYIHRVARPSKRALAAVPVAIVEGNGRRPDQSGANGDGNGRSRIDLRKDVENVGESPSELGIVDLPPVRIQAKYGGISQAPATDPRIRNHDRMPSGSRIELQKNGYEGGNGAARSELAPPARQQGRTQRSPQLQQQAHQPQQPHEPRQPHQPQQHSYHPQLSREPQPANGRHRDAAAPDRSGEPRSRTQASPSDHMRSDARPRTAPGTADGSYRNRIERNGAPVQRPPADPIQPYEGPRARHPVQQPPAPESVDSDTLNHPSPPQPAPAPQSCSGLPPLRFTPPAPAAVSDDENRPPSEDRSKFVRVPPQRTRNRP